MTVGTIATKAVETWERLGFAPITADTQTTPPPAKTPEQPVKERRVEDVSDRYVDTTPKTAKLVSEADATHTVETMAAHIVGEVGGSVTGRLPTAPALQNISAPKTVEGQEAARAFKGAQPGKSFDELMRQGRE